KNTNSHCKQIPRIKTQQPSTRPTPHRITTCLRGWQIILTQIQTVTNKPVTTSNNISLYKTGTQ
ncbi:hypothetical protein GIB67_004904, partial [Kingdonia uniflora]